MMEATIAKNSKNPLDYIDPNPPEVRLERRVHLTETVLFNDGITRAGKGMTGPILASLDRVEIKRVEEILEYIGALHLMGKLKRDAAVSMLRMETDMHLYNNMIARNTNFRPGDYSSLWRYPDPLKYIKRLFSKEGQDVIRRVRAEKPIYQNTTHDQLHNFELYYEAFGERFRMVETVRHPVDLADAWLRRGWGHRFGGDPTALAFCLDYQGQDLPYYARGWEELYLKSSPAGRVIRTINRLWFENQKTYQSLSPEKKKHIFFVPFESFVQSPYPYLEALAEFLGSRLTRRTPRALKLQRCPRQYSADKRQERLARIRSQASSEDMEVLEWMCRDYEAFIPQFLRS